MRRLLLGVVLVAGLLTFAPQAKANSTSCATQPVKSQFVDAQSWWTRTPGKTGNDFGHLHLGACIPERETLSAPIDMPVRVVMHHNPGKFLYVSLVAKGTNYETTVAKYPISGFTCPVGSCEKWLSVRLDPAMFVQSGLQEVRLRAFVDQPDKNRMIASLNWQTYIANAAPKANVTRQPWLRGKGWYTGSGYCEGALPTLPLPDAPLTGTWSPTVRVADHAATGDLPVSRHDVRLDPDLHNGIQGTVLLEGTGSFIGQISVDTTKLVNGNHKLMLRSHCDDPRGSTNSGVLVVPFTVANPEPVSPTPA